jgi:SAM-dependent methyltransferase
MDKSILDGYNSQQGADKYTVKFQKHWWERLNNRTEQKLMANLLASIPKEDLTGISLDMPCGYGRLYPFIRAVAPKVIEGDYSFYLLKEAKDRLVTQGMKKESTPDVIASEARQSRSRDDFVQQDEKERIDDALAASGSPDPGATQFGSAFLNAPNSAISVSKKHDTDPERVSSIREVSFPPPNGFARGTALQMPFRDNAFDLVQSIRLCHHISSEEERLQYLRELCRIANKYILFTYFDTNSIKNKIHAAKIKRTGKRPKWTLTRDQVGSIAKESGFEIQRCVPLSRFFSGHRYTLLKRIS